MGAIASLITSLTIVYSTICSDLDQRKHQSSTSLAFVRGMASNAKNVSIWWRHHVSLHKCGCVWDGSPRGPFFETAKRWYTSVLSLIKITMLVSCISIDFTLSPRDQIKSIRTTCTASASRNIEWEGMGNILENNMLEARISGKTM